MFPDFYITRLSNDMNNAVQKNHLGGQILYRSLDPSKKRRQRGFCLVDGQHCMEHDKKYRISGSEQKKEHLFFDLEKIVFFLIKYEFKFIYFSPLPLSLADW